MTPLNLEDNPLITVFAELSKLSKLFSNSFQIGRLISAFRVLEKSLPGVNYSEEQAKHGIFSSIEHFLSANKNIFG
jgi:hypothetical protein